MKITLIDRAMELNTVLKEWSTDFEVIGASSISAEDIFDPTTAKGSLRIWVVIKSPLQARLYFAARTGDRFYVRDVPLSAGLDEIGRETLTQVIVTTARAFENESLVSSVAEVEASFAVPVANPTTQPAAVTPTERAVGHVRLSGNVTPQAQETWDPDLGVSYRATVINAVTVGHGPTVALGIRLPIGQFRWRFIAQGQYRIPLQVKETDLSLTLRTTSWSITTGPQWDVGKKLSFGLSTGTGIERTQVELTMPKDAAVIPLPAHVHYRPFVDFTARVGLSLEGLRVVALFGGQVALVRTHYDIASTPVFTPWLVAPYVGAELNW